MRKTILIATVGLLSLVGCAQSNTSTSENTNSSTNSGTTETVETVENEIKRVTKSEFKAYLEENNSVQLIDVRTPGEFRSGTIEGAKNIDFNSANFEENINALDKSVPVLIFCRSGGRSSRALKVFKANGFSTVLELEGGYMNW